MFCVHDSFMPVALLNLDDAVATMLLFIAALFPLGSSRALALPIHMRFVQRRAPGWSCDSEQKAACCESSCYRVQIH